MKRIIVHHHCFVKCLLFFLFYYSSSAQPPVINVDLGKEFIDMILTSTGYSASSRVIKTTDDLMQQLLVLGR